MNDGIDAPADRRLHGEALLRRATVWAGLGVMVATGAAAAAVAHALPGKTAAATAPATSSSAGSVPTGGGTGIPSTGGGTAGTVPAPANSAPVVTSGGS